MHRKNTLLVVLMMNVVAACNGAAPHASVQELSGGAMGTTFSIKLVSAPDTLDLGAMRKDVEQTLAVIEQQMSTYIADSELSLFNAQRSADWFGVSADLCVVVAEALTLSAATNGAFDITVGPLVNLWGFGPQGQVTAPPDADSITALLLAVGRDSLHTDCSVPALRKDLPDIYVDLSAFAKGYGVDRLADLLDAAAVENYLVEIGGELRVRGKNQAGERWGIAIESPSPAGRSVRSVVKLSDAAVATSGDYRNFFEHDGRMYSHTIDPRSGYPVSHDAASVTVVADTAGLADAMATALLVMGPDDGIAFAEREGIAALFLVRDNSDFRELVSSQYSARVGTQ